MGDSARAQAVLEAFVLDVDDGVCCRVARVVCVQGPVKFTNEKCAWLVV